MWKAVSEILLGEAHVFCFSGAAGNRDVSKNCPYYRRRVISLRSTAMIPCVLAKRKDKRSLSHSLAHLKGYNLTLVIR